MLPIPLHNQVTVRLWLTLLLASLTVLGGEQETRTFIREHCLDCHDADSKKGELDLSSLSLALNTPKVFSTWVTVHDRVASGEMPPPKKKGQPTGTVRARFTNQLAHALTEAEHQLTERNGRTSLRRLNRYEYEETLRDLLSLPALEVKGFLPEDPVAYGFNKVGDALDVSHVQLSRSLQAADFA